MSSRQPAWPHSLDELTPPRRFAGAIRPSRAADVRRRQGRIISFATRLLLAAYFLEAGLILIIAPWSGFWERNFFAGAMPWLDSLFANLYVRGAVSGLGVVTLAAGLAELAAAFGQRRQTAAGQPGRTLPFDR